MPTHQANRETRRRQIITAARQLAADRGVENTPMEDIAKRAKCTRRTLYAYFLNWDDLFLQVYVEDLADRWKYQQAAMVVGDTGLDQLRLWGESYFAYSQHHPQSLRLQFFWDFRGLHSERTSADTRSALEDVMQPLVAKMRDMLFTGQKDGSIRSDLDPDTILGQYAYTLRAIMNRALFPAYSFAEFQPEAFVENYLDFFLHGISAKAPKELS